MRTSEWTGAERVAGALARADGLPHRSEGHEALLQMPPQRAERMLAPSGAFLARAS